MPLKTISAHDAPILLRSSFSAPKLLHTLRCTPCDGHPLLETHDDLLREGVSAICNSYLGDHQWIQASLAVREGGLGIRCVSSLVLSAFLASAASTSELQTLILLNCPSGVDNTDHEARVRWSLTTFHTPATRRVFRSTTDAPRITRDWTTIWNDSVNDLDKARLLAIKAAHSSDWLFALPISSCGLRMCDQTIRVAVCLRLGLNLSETHTCPCGALVSARVIHDLSCKRSAGSSTRHHQVNDLI